MDVEQLKKIKSGQICKACKVPKPLSDFYESSAGSGKYVRECKSCTKARVAAQAAAKKHGQNIALANLAQTLAVDAIDKIATNIAPESIGDAINSKKVNDISQVVSVKPQSLIDRDFNGNTFVDEMERDYPVKLKEIPPGGKSEIEEKPKVSLQSQAASVMLEEKPILLFCRKCGHQGPPDDFHRAGKHGATSVCKRCARITWKEVNARDHRKRMMVGMFQRVVDFSEYPEILENLRADAQRNFRTLNNEILFRLIGEKDV